MKRASKILAQCIEEDRSLPCAARPHVMKLILPITSRDVVTLHFTSQPTFLISLFGIASIRLGGSPQTVPMYILYRKEDSLVVFIDSSPLRGTRKGRSLLSKTVIETREADRVEGLSR